MSQSERQYVSRGGLKLAAALDAFGINPRGWTCVDLGSHVGGFVDCLLQRGAAKVYAVEPGYGVLDAKLRRDPRVVVCERTNALEYRCPEPCDLATIDIGWTPLRLALPGVRRMLKPGGGAIALVKPQYEADKRLLRGGRVPEERLPEVLDLCRRDTLDLRWRIAGEHPSPLTGHGGNIEFLWRLEPRG